MKRLLLLAFFMLAHQGLHAYEISLDRIICDYITADATKHSQLHSIIHGNKSAIESYIKHQSTELERKALSKAIETKIELIESLLLKKRTENLSKNHKAATKLITSSLIGVISAALVAIIQYKNAKIAFKILYYLRSLIKKYQLSIVSTYNDTRAGLNIATGFFSYTAIAALVCAARSAHEIVTRSYEGNLEKEKEALIECKNLQILLRNLE